MTFKPLTHSGAPSGSNPSWPSNSMNNYRPNFSSTSTWTPPNREWSVSYPPPNSNIPSYSSIPRPSNPMNNYSSSFSSTPTWTPSNREWTAPQAASYPNYSQLGTQKNHSPLSYSTPTYSSSLTTRDFSTCFPSQNSNLSRNARSTDFQFSSLTPPHFSPRDSFSFKDFSSLRPPSSNERFAQITSFNWNRLESVREQNLKISPPRVLWTIEDRSFQAFRNAMKLDAPFETFLTTISPRPLLDSKPLTIDVSSFARSSKAAPHISTAKVTVIDTGVGFWNGTKRAFALIGLEQMEISGQERIEILDTMAATDQASRTAFKEKMLSSDSSELHPISVAKNYARHFISKEVNDAINDPRFQGGMQALGGVSEASVGAPLLFTPLTPLGAALMIHGADHFVAGTRSMIAGSPIPTASELMLQRMGMTPEKAAFINNLASISGILKGINSIRHLTYQTNSFLILKSEQMIPSIAANRAVFEEYKIQLRVQMEKPSVLNAKLGEISGPAISIQSTFETANNTKWILPKNGGGAFINNRWYTEHALERMAPRTPAVMAELENRFFERAKTASEKLSPQRFREWCLENAPNPRGVPPLVVEAEIAQTGSTGVRVILNEKKQVVTVIPGDS